MNAIQQISLKLRLGIDPASNIQSDQLLQKWQVLNARRCRARALQRVQEQPPVGPGKSSTAN